MSWPEQPGPKASRRGRNRRAKRGKNQGRPSRHYVVPTVQSGQSPHSARLCQAVIVFAVVARRPSRTSVLGSLQDHRDSVRRRVAAHGVVDTFRQGPRRVAAACGRTVRSSVIVFRASWRSAGAACLPVSPARMSVRIRLPSRSPRDRSNSTWAARGRSAAYACGSVRHCLSTEGGVSGGGDGLGRCRPGG